MARTDPKRGAGPGALLVKLACALAAVLVAGFLLRPLLHGSEAESPRREAARAAEPARGVGAGRIADPAPGPAAAEPAPPAAAPGNRPAAAADGQIPLSALAIQLVGTVTNSAPEKARALVADGDEQAEVRKIGDLLAGGAARIAQIERQRIVIDHQGRLEFVPVTQGAAAGESGELSAQEFFDLPLDQLEKYMRRPSEMRLAVDLGTAVAELGGMAKFTQEKGESGVQVDRFKRNAPLAQLGLRPGDRILEVDGNPVRSVDDGISSLARSLYSEGGTTILTLERFDGTRTQIATPSGALLRLKSER